MNNETFPGLKKRQLTETISWEYYKHWGQCYCAGEGLEEMHGDHSGCIHRINGTEWTNPPSVVQARVYKGFKGAVSAVYSYPYGIGLEDHYFWEIYGRDGVETDVERYDTEEEMEERIKEILE